MKLQRGHKRNARSSLCVSFCWLLIGSNNCTISEQENWRFFRRRALLMKSMWGPKVNVSLNASFCLTNFLITKIFRNRFLLRSNFASIIEICFPTAESKPALGNKENLKRKQSFRFIRLYPYVLSFDQ